jgi:DNA-binding beta-propeller fold protein YncE
MMKVNELIPLSRLLTANGHPDSNREPTATTNLLAYLTLLTLFPLLSTAQSHHFTIPEKDLFPEGIAFDSTDNAIYISSILKNKIVVRNGNNISDFIESDQYGFMGGVGLHVDTKRRILWACSGNIMSDRYRAGLFAFSLPSGKLLKKMIYPESSTPYFFNDLTIAKDGSVYITNTADHSIWKWDAEMDAPVKLLLNDSLNYPNGIVMDPQGKFLLVATDRGLERITVNSGEVRMVGMPSGPETSKGLDGLVFYQKSIIAVQNGFRNNAEMRVIRYFLSSDFSKVETIQVIDKGNPLFDIPTTLVVGKGYLYVIANSQLGNLDQEKLRVIDSEKLEEIFVLRYKL